jgi:Protein of unknown function (DUF1579)
MKISLPLFLGAFAIYSSGIAFAQQSPKPTTSSAKTDNRPAPTAAAASPEQDILKQWVGNWEATIESTGRDGKPVKNPAKATAKLVGGRWLITDFDGTFGGAPFIGHEVLGYDPVAKKYLLSWVDATATSFATGEGLYNSRSKTLTLTVTGRDDSTGKMVTWRQVDIWKDADHHEWSLRTISPKDAKEQNQLTILYRRRPKRG